MYAVLESSIDANVYNEENGIEVKKQLTRISGSMKVEETYLCQLF